MTRLTEQPATKLPFIALEAATLLSGIGNGVASIALPWLALELTGDPAAAGLLAAASAIPTLIASLGSGVIIDRLGRKRTSVGSDIFSAISAMLIPVWALAGILTYPIVVFAAVLGSTFDPVGVTAREAMLPDVAKRAKYALERVNGVHEAVWGLAWLIGPGVAGLLIALIGAANTFWAMFAGFVASALFVGIAGPPTPPPVVHERQHWVTDAIDGLRFVVRDPAIRSTTVLSTISFALTYSVIAVVLPVVYERLNQPQALGMLLVAFSGGGVVGALAYSAIGARISRRTAFVTGLWAAALVMVTLAISPAFWIEIVAMAVGGFLSGPVNPVVNVVLQERAPEEMRGRALSMVFALGYAVAPLGYVAAGYGVKAASPSVVFWVMAAVCSATAIWGMLTPALRSMYGCPGGDGICEPAVQPE